MPDPQPPDDADELAYLLHEFITAPTFYAKQRLVEGNPGLLLSSYADSALAALILEYADHEQMRETLTLHRAILERCRRDGIREAFAQVRRELGEGRRLEDMPADEVQALVATVGEFITTTDWEEARAYLDEHPELLQPASDAVIERLIETHTRRQEVNVVRHLVVHRDLLRAVRELGAEAAFGRLADPPDTLDLLAENTIAVLTERPRERANWHQTVQMSRIRAAELGDEPTRRLLEAISRLLDGHPAAEVAPDVEGEHAAAWERIAAAAGEA